MRTYYLFEIEADEIPIYNLGEWENEHTITQDSNQAQKTLIIGYGELKDGRYIELYEKAPLA